MEEQKTEGEHKKPLLIRTLKSDLETTVKEKNISLSDIAIAEAKRSGEALSSTPEQKNILRYALLAALPLLFGAIFLIYRFAIPQKPPADTLGPPRPTPLIFAEDIKELGVSDIYRNMKEGTDEGGILIFLPRTETGYLSASELFETLELSAPPELARSFEKNFSLGKYGPNGFYLGKTSSYEQAFAGMLLWEKIMPEDMRSLLSGNKQVADTKGFAWHDKVIRNIDTRVLANNDGAIKLIYAFLDRKTFVITTNETTFGEVVTRFNTPGQVVR